MDEKETIAEDLGSIVKACALVEEAIAADRYIEANGWLDQIKEGAKTIDDTLEGLMEQERKEKLGLSF